MVLLDYIVNLAIFAFLIFLPIVAGSFSDFKPLKHYRLIVGFYGGMVSAILVALAIHRGGYIYDIRYAAVIISFAYFGPVGGVITAICSISARLLVGGQLATPIIGWLIIVAGFCIAHVFTARFTAVKRSVIFFALYAIIYFIEVPIIFNVLRDKPLFHIEYVAFVLLGVITGVLLIESYLKLYRMNSRLIEMYKMVEKSESKYRLIAENTSDLIKVMRKNHSVTYFSPSHELILGHQLSELEGVELCKFIHPNDVDFFRKTVQRMFDKEEAQSMEIRFLHQDGRWIEFESRCMPVRGENELIEHLVIVSRDISERKKSEEILLQSEKLSIVGELAAGVAHEIRNPLTTIKGFVQLYKAANSSFEYSDLLLGELSRIETITSEMLSLGKPQAVKLTRADLRELIDNTIEFISPQALMTGIQMNTLFEGAPFPVICEKNQLKQVFLNIIKNAMEAMPKGGDIDIHLCKGVDGDCIVTIKDHGCGIPEELLPRLGEPFYSLKEKGTGLGVMICHKIIKQHKGSISYSSKQNEGTVVEIKLPLAI